MHTRLFMALGFLTVVDVHVFLSIQVDKEEHWWSKDCIYCPLYSCIPPVLRKGEISFPKSMTRKYLIGPPKHLVKIFDMSKTTKQLHSSC